MVLTATRTMTTSNRRHLSWIDYYIKASEELHGPSATCEGGHSTFDRLPDEYIKDEAKFIRLVEENPGFNFLLLPTSVKGLLNVVHCNSAFSNSIDDTVSLIGVNGTRFNSPWKVIDTDKVTAPMRQPSRRSHLLSIPSLRTLLTCSSTEEFINLKGEEKGSSFDLLDRLPNALWLAPQLFITCIDSGSIRSEELAILIINKVSSDAPQGGEPLEEGGEIPESYREVHQTLV